MAATWCWRAMRRAWLLLALARGFYYAMVGGRVAATAAQAALASGKPKDLALARKAVHARA